MSVEGQDSYRRRTRGSVPGFQGNSYVHTNPLPAITGLPSFSYGSPTTVLPKAPRAQDTKINAGDLIQAAANQAKLRIEAEATERRKSIDEARARATSRAASETQRRRPSPEPDMTSTPNTPRRGRGMSTDVEAVSARKSTLRSGSVLSRATSVDQDSDQENRSQIGDLSDQETFNQGDQTSAEIFNIINKVTTSSSTNLKSGPSMLRNRSINVGRRASPEVSLQPRSALKGSRDEAPRKIPTERTKPNTASSRSRQGTYTPTMRKDTTYSEEFSIIGGAIGRRSSPALTPVSEIRSTPRNAPNGTQYETDDELYNGDLNENQYFGTMNGIASKIRQLFGPTVIPHVELDEEEVELNPTPPYTQRIQQSVYQFLAAAKKNTILVFYFLKQLLGYWVLASMCLLLVSGVTWSFRDPLMDVAGDVLKWRPNLPNLPYFRSGFRPSGQLPTSMEEFANRMLEVESYLKSLDEMQRSNSKEWKLETKSERVRREGLEKELSSMTRMLSKISGVTNDFARHQSAYSQNEVATKTVLGDIQRTLAAMDNNIKINEKDIKTSNLGSDHIRKHLERIQGKIDEVKDKVERLESGQELSEQAVARWEKMLPDQIATRIDPKTGKIVIAPELWRQLQGLFRKDMEDYVRSNMPSGSSKGQGQAGDIQSWDTWLVANQAKLAGYVGTEYDNRWRKAVAEGNVIQKEYFVNNMKRELEAFRKDMEIHNKDRYRQIVADAQKAAKSVASSYVQRNSGGSGGGKAVDKYAIAMVQAVLHHHSAVVLQRPDYALQARGNFIIPALTASTFQPNFGRVLGLVNALVGQPSHGPTEALTESVAVGSCWSFPKSTGHIAFIMSTPIYPTEVTVDHVPAGISGDVSSAPRDMEFWVKISDDDLREQVGRAAAVSLGDVAPSKMTEEYRRYKYVRVASFSYDAKSAYPTQTFELAVVFQELGVHIDEVSFRILNNWGNDEYTSLYRLRVHGEEAGRQSQAELVEEKIPAL